MTIIRLSVILGIARVGFSFVRAAQALVLERDMTYTERWYAFFLIPGRYVGPVCLARTRVLRRKN